jgi:hypothetical protein
MKISAKLSGTRANLRLMHQEYYAFQTKKNIF